MTHMGQITLLTGVFPRSFRSCPDDSDGLSVRFGLTVFHSLIDLEVVPFAVAIASALTPMGPKRWCRREGRFPFAEPERRSELRSGEPRNDLVATRVGTDATCGSQAVACKRPWLSSFRWDVHQRSDGDELVRPSNAVAWTIRLGKALSALVPAPVV